MKRAGFTMIELIFVIVILGILGAVAIPKLQGVKDDAELANANENFCINAKGRMMVYAARNNGSLVGLKFNTIIDMPNGWAAIDSGNSGATDGSTALVAGDLSAVNAANVNVKTFTNSTSNISVYLVDGNATTNYGCYIGDANYAGTTSAANARTANDNYL